MMRKLKLQMQISLDGFVSGINGNEAGFSWDDESKDYSIKNLEDVDNVLLGRKVAVDFIPYWRAAGEKPGNPEYLFGKTVSEIAPIIFSNTLKPSEAHGAEILSGDIVEEVNKLKNRDGKSILVYGGAGFVSSLIKHGLIDEYHFLVNPVALGNGLPIFNALDNNLQLKLVTSKQLGSGTVVQCYEKI